MSPPPLAELEGTVSNGEELMPADCTTTTCGALSLILRQRLNFTGATRAVFTTVDVPSRRAENA